MKPQVVKSQPAADVSMSPPVPKPPSPARDVHMSGSTPIPAKVLGTPSKPGYTPVKSPDYKKARRTLFEDDEANIKITSVNILIHSLLAVF